MKTAEEKINGIIEWAESDGPGGFDLTFVEDLAEQYAKRGSISAKQEEALDNIIDKWGIDLSQYL